MNTVSYRRTVSVVLAFLIATGTGGLHAQGITDYKPGKGGSPVTGPASDGAVKDAAPTLEHGPAPLGTVAVAEPQEFTSKTLLQYSCLRRLESSAS